jgi:hypothetical protein
MSQIMQSFEAGLFVGDDNLPEDNLDGDKMVQKTFRHERKIHGHKHVGMRIVNEGPTLLLALDAHLLQSNPGTNQDLLPYVYVKPPESQIQSISP